MGYAGINHDVLVYHSFITNILGPLIPDIIHNFELKDLAMAGFIPTSFSWLMPSCRYRQAY